VVAAGSNPEVINQVKNNPNSIGSIDNIKLHALKDYYQYLMDIEACDQFAKLMINDIKRIRPDALIISFYEDPSLSDEPSFNSYLKLQSRSFGNIPFSKIIKYTETRCVCHYTPEINKILYEDILTALQTGIWRPVIPETITLNPIDYYYNLNT
jgi:hypothetical protein